MNSPESKNQTLLLLVKIYIWRKKFIIISACAAVISLVICLLMSPQYKATAVVFPARNFSVSKLLIEQNQGAQEDYMDIGDEDDAEKLLQLLNSSEIRNKIADKYDLWTNWEIKKNTAYTQHYLKLKWEDMVSFKRTNFVSIKVEVHDYVANRAADIANSIIDYADTVKFKMTKEIAKQALLITKTEYETTILRIKELEDSLQSIKNLGVLDYPAEMKAYSKEMAKAIEKGNEAGQKRIQEKLDLLKKYGASYGTINSNLKKYRFKYPIIKNKYDEALVNYNNPMPSKFVVDRAIGDEKKVKPFISLIVLVSTVSTFIFALIYLIFLEHFADFKKKVNHILNEQNGI
jgi:tyrosine-protein kinase Etk/Wzc